MFLVFAKAPVSQATATDADQIHDPVTRRAKLGANNLRENRHVVPIKEPPAETEEHEKQNCDLETSRVPESKDGGNNAAQADRAHVDSPANVSLDPEVSQNAAQHRPRNRGELPRERRPDSRWPLL